MTTSTKATSAIRSVAHCALVETAPQARRTAAAPCRSRPRPCARQLRAAVANTRSDSGGSAIGQRLALARCRGRASGWPRSRRRARRCGSTSGASVRAAEGAEEIRASDADRERRSASLGSTSRTRTSSGRSPSVTRGAGVQPAERRCRRARARRPAPGPGPATVGVEEVHRADEVGDEGGRRAAVDLGRRADLLDRRPGSSPRCGRPWRAPPPGRA